jgi:hypothetical protein
MLFVNIFLKIFHITNKLAQIVPTTFSQSQELIKKVNQKLDKKTHLKNKWA